VSNFLLPKNPVTSLDEYLAGDVGGLGLQRAQEIGASATIEEVMRAGLRGRGGGGFPTGRKWASIVNQPGSERYVVCNGAEGEPGTFKDRALMRANPYQLVEGVLIAAYAVDAAGVFICLKASFEPELEAVTRAVQEIQTAGICPDCSVTIVRGPEEYLYGEEKALLEVIEGRDPLPGLLPPYIHGLFATRPQMGWDAQGAEPGRQGPQYSNPTLVNNVETLSNVPHILALGSEWFRTIGTGPSPGTLVCTVVGDVVSPGVAELELGTPLREVIQAAGGGPSRGRTIKAVFSGVANPVITAEQLDVPLSWEGFEAIGSGMGASGFIVYDDTACMIEVARLFSRFLYVESCGQCPPCKLGSGEITARLERIEAGTGTDGDVEGIVSWLGRVTDGNRCYLPVEERLVVESILRAFPEEIAEHIDTGFCPRPRYLSTPKIVDLRDGKAVYDERQDRKLPDWTYSAGVATAEV
jgi:NADH:ubiquinone oxidoreductase subunit F (NADH-binding)